MDIKTLKKSINLSDLVGRFVSLDKKKGQEYLGACPFHDDSSPSLNVNDKKGLWMCGPCDMGGDHIDFLVAMGRSQEDAIKELRGDIAQGENNPVRNTPKKPSPAQTIWKPIIPVPAEAGEPNFKHYQLGEPNGSWRYLNELSQLICHVARYDDAQTGEKETRMLTYCESDQGRREWRWQGTDLPRPLYGLQLLAERPDATVVVVEGEKCADAINRLLPHCLGISWPFGTNSVDKTDWKPLIGRKVVFWKDNDTVGHLAMFGGWKARKNGDIFEVDGIADILKGKAKVLKAIKIPQGKPKGWDCADAEAEGWTPESTREYIKNNLIDIPEHMQQQKPPPPAPENPPIPESLKAPAQAPAQAPAPSPAHDGQPSNSDEDWPFRVLGFIKDGRTPTYCFYSNASKTVTMLSAPGMNTSNLITLAPLHWWQANFKMRGGKGPFDINAATNSLVSRANLMGIFDPARMRGRGAWMDEGRVVLHVGSHLIVDDQPRPFSAHRSRFIYEQSKPLNMQTENPLSSKEAASVIEMFKKVNWEREINAWLIAGWCVVAPVCGALPWRPHIWITGAAGTGKTNILYKVRDLIGDAGVNVQGNTSEAGIRQFLAHDAMPVIFDEAEGNSSTKQSQMQEVLSLMRAASSENGGEMLKGSSHGSATSFKIRSCFAFASIVPQVREQSDRTRVTMLNLQKVPKNSGNDARWGEFLALSSTIATPEFSHRLQARTISILPIILKNARVFAAAAAAVIGDQRAGDQLGAMLAGAFSLTSTREVDFDFAHQWCLNKDWNEEKGLEETRDETKLLNFLLDYMTGVESNSMRRERTIGELIRRSMSEFDDPVVDAVDAENRLRRIGFRMHRDNSGKYWILIASQSQFIDKALFGQPWYKQHAKILMRIESAQSKDNVTFSPGNRVRAVMIPYDVLQDDERKTSRQEFNPQPAPSAPAQMSFTETDEWNADGLPY